MMMKKSDGAANASPGPSQIRAATSTTPAASMMSIGWKTSWNCGMPRSNSSWNVDSAMSRPPGSQTLAQVLDPPAPRGRSWPSRFIARMTSTWMHGDADSVMQAPPMSMRCVGPHSVTSWPKSRCQRSSSGKPSSEKLPAANMMIPPSGAYQSRVIFTNVGPSFFVGRQIAKKPAMTIPYSPARMK